jgi:hypothetical protein
MRASIRMSPGFNAEFFGKQPKTKTDSSRRALVSSGKRQPGPDTSPSFLCPRFAALLD